MPELPDIAAYLTALEPRILGEPLTKIRIASPFLLRTFTPTTTAFENQTVRTLRRVGKRIAIGFDHDLWLVLHLMIAGRLHWKPTAASLAGKNQLAAFDFSNGTLLLTEAGSSRRASLHLFSSTEEMLSLDPGGLDVFSITPEQFQSAMTKENHTLKRALTDPRILSGIGNAYSDEILHAARLSPIQQTNKLTAGEWQRLFHQTRAVLQQWTDRLKAEAQYNFPEKVTAFRPDMAVHGRFGQPCPVCTQPIQRIRYAGNETVPVQRELEKRRYPLVSIPPFGRGFSRYPGLPIRCGLGRARKANFRAREHRLDEPARLSLGMVASLQSPLPFHPAKSL